MILLSQLEPPNYFIYHIQPEKERMKETKTKQNEKQIPTPFYLDTN